MVPVNLDSSDASQVTNEPETPWPSDQALGRAPELELETFQADTPMVVKTTHQATEPYTVWHTPCPPAATPGLDLRSPVDRAWDWADSWQRPNRNAARTAGPAGREQVPASPHQRAEWAAKPCGGHPHPYPHGNLKPTQAFKDAGPANKATAQVVHRHHLDTPPGCAAPHRGVTIAHIHPFATARDRPGGKNRSAANATFGSNGSPKHLRVLSHPWIGSPAMTSAKFPKKTGKPYFALIGSQV
jgi:hypothetical protein